MKLKMSVAILLLTNIVLSETIYRFPPVRYVTRNEIRQRFLNEGKMLMDIKCIPDGDEMLVCTNWVCPTSIVVNTVQYSLVTDSWMGVISADIMSIGLSTGKVAHIEIHQGQNEREARRSVFAGLVQSDVWLPADFAPRIIVNNLDPMTNMMYVADTYHGETNNQIVVYRNFAVFSDAQTNAVDFAVAIINAGLPESERIALPTEQ